MGITSVAQIHVSSSGVPPFRYSESTITGLYTRDTGIIVRCTYALAHLFLTLKVRIGFATYPRGPLTVKEQSTSWPCRLSCLVHTIATTSIRVAPNGRYAQGIG